MTTPFSNNIAHSNHLANPSPRIAQLSPVTCNVKRYETLKAHHGVLHQSVSAFLASTTTYPSIEALIAMVSDPVIPALMNRFPNLKLISNYGVGYNNVDLTAAKNRGIQVTNTPAVLSEAVADLTWALILAATRRIVYSDRYTRNGEFTGWAHDLHLGVDVHGKTLGVFGAGDIGQQVLRRSMGFNMRRIYHNRQRLSPDLEAALDAQWVPFDVLLAESDILSIHAPLTPENHHRFNAKTLAQMKPQSVLINTARGPLIEEGALVEALKNGPLFAAGLDVFEQEPLIHPGLLPLENVVLTAHIGSATHSAREGIGNLVLSNLEAFLTGQPLVTPIVLPS